MNTTANPPWGRVDFSHNKSFWNRWGHGAALPFRIRNLVAVQSALRDNLIASSLFGGTLRDAFHLGALAPDHDDDLIVSDDDFLKLPKIGIPALEALGFSVIRNTPSILSVLRDGRYIDIHPFDQWPIETVEFLLHGSSMQMHVKSAEILEEKYGPSDPNRLVPGESRTRAHLKSGLQKATELARHGRVSPVGMLLRVSRELRRRLRLKISQKHRSGQLVLLTREDFLQLKIDADSAGNWAWRGQHLRAICNEGETFDDVLARKAVEKPQRPSDIVETPLDRAVEEPVSLSRSFWKRGNNFFYYPFLYGFRHQVLPYHAANLYILSGQRPMLYSAEYFESLPAMTESEIRSFLRSNPIEITNGAVTSGRHRAAAMLGRLHRGEVYIELAAVVKQ